MYHSFALVRSCLVRTGVLNSTHFFFHSIASNLALALNTVNLSEELPHLRDGPTVGSALASFLGLWRMLVAFAKLGGLKHPSFFVKPGCGTWSIPRYLQSQSLDHKMSEPMIKSYKIFFLEEHPLTRLTSHCECRLLIHVHIFHFLCETLAPRKHTAPARGSHLESVSTALTNDPHTLH